MLARMAKANGSGGSDVIRQLMTAVGELKESMHEQAQRTEAMSEALRVGFAQLGSRMKTSEHLLGRVAKLLGEFATQTQNRFDKLEDRMDRLEHASGK